MSEQTTYNEVVTKVKDSRSKNMIHKNYCIQRLVNHSHIFSLILGIFKRACYINMDSLPMIRLCTSIMKGQSITSQVLILSRLLVNTYYIPYISLL